MALKLQAFRDQAQAKALTTDRVKEMLTTHFSQSERSHMYGTLDREVKKDPSLKDRRCAVAHMSGWYPSVTRAVVHTPRGGD